MDNSTFEAEASRTLLLEPDFKPTPAEIMLVWNALGLAGEAGEVANLIKKRVFHRRPVTATAIADELGDVLWYINAICLELGTSISEVMEINVSKLRARFPDGWDRERSEIKG